MKTKLSSICSDIFGNYSQSRTKTIGNSAWDTCKFTTICENNLTRQSYYTSVSEMSSAHRYMALMFRYVVQ
jgi:hypothetical protein